MSWAEMGVSALSERLRSSASSRPSHPVVRSAGRVVEQAELAAWTAELAGRVVDAVPGSGGSSSPWTPVLVDWSVRSVVGVQAMVWAGRRFALIDPALPTSRLTEMWARLGDPRLAVVADPAHASVLPDGVRAVPVEAPPGGQGAPIEPQPVAGTEPGVVIFTSGSTGRPKGVLKGWASFERALTTQLTMWPDGLERRPNHGHLRPLYFNGAINVAALTALGCTVELFDPGAGDLDGLLERIHAAGIGSIGPGPALAAAMVRAAGGTRRLPLVTSVNMGGAACPWDLVAGIRTLAAPGVRVRAGYGATESGNIMSFRIDPDTPVGTGMVPMGRPSDPTRLRLVPLEPGSAACQAWIREPEALGYLGDPELTATRFVTVDGARWWISGDVADVDAEGVFHHHGRVDDLVKLNGMLVEPGEAERALRAVPGVHDAAVVTVQAPSVTGEPGRLRLVAHLCLDDPALTPAGLRRQLLETLPGPLVPSVFMVHDRFPLTNSGKVDKVTLRALPLVPWGAGGRREPEPSDQLGWAVLGICREVLDLTDLGPDDDLWLMGMDSLAAVELSAALAAQGLGDVQPAQLVEWSSAAALTAALDGAPVERSTDVVTYHPDGTAPPIFAIPGAGATALTYRGVTQALGADQPLVVVEAHGMHTRGRPDRSVEAMATRARLEIERRLGPDDVLVLIGHSAGGIVAYEIAQQRAARGAPTRLVMIDAVPAIAGRALNAVAPTTPAASRSLGDRAARARVRLRRHALTELPGVAARQLRIAAYRVAPGRPRPDVLRYSSFGWRLQRASRRYRGAPVAFPCTVIAVEGSTAPARARALGPDVTVHTVGGDHRSCMEFPHAPGVARLIEAEAALISRR